MKLDRLLGILTVLLQNERVTAPYLAERFEVTRRTIGRDIDALCRAGIPVVTGQGAGGGIWIAEGYKLDKSVLTEGELSGLIAGLKGLGSVSDPSEVERTLLKLGGGKDAVASPIVINLASHYQGSLTEKIKRIKRAVVGRQLIEFEYHSSKGVSRRRVEPYFVTFQWSDWYAFGYCTQRQDWRLFKLARLWDLALCDEVYAPREIPEARMEFAFKDEHRLVALFDPSARYQLVESYGLGSFTEQPDGMLRLEVGYSHPDYILSWILSFGDRAKVLEPAGMARQIREIAQKMLERYD